MTNTERYPGDDDDVQGRLNRLIDDLALAKGELAEAVAVLRQWAAGDRPASVADTEPGWAEGFDLLLGETDAFLAKHEVSHD